MSQIEALNNFRHSEFCIRNLIRFRFQMQIHIFMSHVLAPLRIFYAGPALQDNWADFGSDLPLPTIDGLSAQIIL